jgi:alpha-L-fucosidase
MRIRLTVIALLLLSFTRPATCAGPYEPNWDSLDRRPMPAWFADAKFGIIIHWGVYSVPAYAPINKEGETGYSEWYWNSLITGREKAAKDGTANSTYQFHQRWYGDDFTYEKFAPMFRAEFYDPDQWAEIFRRSGAKYIVPTSKHHDGFALWPSEEASRTWGRPWNSTVAGPMRDLLGELTAAVRKQGLRMGFYYSLYEWYNPLWLSDRPRYVTDHMQPQFKDVVTRYKPDIIFSDGEWEMTSAEWKSPELLAWLFNESPVKDAVVINDRWGKETRHKHGGYYTTEYTAGLAGGEHAWEESRGMGHSYGYNRRESLTDYHTSRELLLMLIDIVSRGGNFLLDVGPTADGRIPVIMQQRLADMGSWLAMNGEAIYGTRSWRNSHQWSGGKVPDMKTGNQFMTRYEVTDFVDRKDKDTAIIEAFFTKKGEALYAILPHRPAQEFLVRDVQPSAGTEVTILGENGKLKFRAEGAGLRVTVPPPPETAQPRYATVLRITGAR